MIVVEGPDGAGKSTLVTKLCKYFDLAEAKHEGSRDDMYKSTKERAYTALAQAVMGTSEPLVYDRCYFSELVYGPAWRDECAFNNEEQMHIEAVMRALNCPIIFCLPSIQTVRYNVKRTEQMAKVDQLIDRIYWAYRRLSTYDLNTWVFNYEEHDPHKFFDRAIAPYLRTRKARTWQ